VARGEARQGARVVAAFGAAQKRQPRARQRVGMPGDILEQQRNRRAGGQVFRVLGEIGQQQKRARIHIAGGSHERDIGPAGKARAQRRMAAAADHPPRRCPELDGNSELSHGQMTPRRRNFA